MSKEVTARFEQRLYVRGPMKIEDLKPSNFIKRDHLTRYDFHELQSLVDIELGIDQRDCGPLFSGKDDFLTWSTKNPNIAPHARWNKYREYSSSDYMNMWHYMMNATFSYEIRNDQTNAIYVGTEEGIDLKKLKVKPNTWQLEILDVYNRLFHHLADKHGRIKVEVWW